MQAKDLQSTIELLNEIAAARTPQASGSKRPASSLSSSTLYFFVPTSLGNDFKVQKYLGVDGKELKQVEREVKALEPYVLCIDLERLFPSYLD